MKENKFNKNVIQLWLFKVSLLFSVFVFSGFNVEVQAAFLESDKTELVDLKIYKPVFSLENSTKEQSKTLSVCSPLGVELFNIWALINHNNLLELKFKAYCKIPFFYNVSSIKLHFKIPSSSSDDDLPA